MKRRQPTRPLFPLPESLNHRLGLYALAAAAAGVGSLAAAPSAEAEVVYTPAHAVIGPGSFYVLDVNHDGNSDFRFGNVFRTSFGVFYIEPWGASRSLNAEQCPSSGPPYPLALRAGAPIGRGERFYGTTGGPTYNQILAGNDRGLDFGNWVDVKNRYVGLRFRVNGEDHYGGARLTVEVNGPAINALLTGYAYETVANRGIRAGQMSGTASESAAPAGAASDDGGRSDSGIERKISSPSKSLGRLALGSEPAVYQ